MPYKNYQDHLNHCKEYYTEHKPETRERSKKWRTETLHRDPDYDHHYYIANREKIIENARRNKIARFIENPSLFRAKEHAQYKKYREKNKLIRSISGKIRRDKNRLLVLQHYSKKEIPECANPFGQHSTSYTTIETLSIDHVNGGGRKHLRAIGDLCNWLITNNYPDGFQVLCMNCQWIKRIKNKEIKLININ
jgi:hypothetical protein